MSPFWYSIAGYCVDKILCLIIINSCAGVVKLVDAEDSKSSGPRVRAGSIPASGTTSIRGLANSGLVFVFNLISSGLP